MRLRAALLSGLASLACASASALPAFDEVKAAHRPSDTLVLDRNDELLHRLRTDSKVRRGPWTPLADVSPALRHAIVMSEDKNFYAHGGVDWQAVSAAAWGNLWNKRTRGASTISMQLAGLLDDDLMASAARRSPAQKVGQAVSASVLDGRWRKDQILEAYLNLVPFRGEVAGIDALSRTLFAKAPQGLDEEESAIAAALVRGPNAKHGVVAQRACGVLKAMRPAGVRTDCEVLAIKTEFALSRRAFEADEGVAPHAARRAIAQGGRADARTGRDNTQAGRVDAPPARVDAQVATTLRADLQRFTAQTLRRHLRELRQRNVEDGALIVLDNATGEVLAWVGSSGDLSDASEVDGVLARRQAGSTLKPFLYAQAIAEKRLTAASLLEDSPAHLATASGLYVPQNYDRQFKGWVSVRTALGASLNVPAVRTVVQVSPEPFAKTLQAAGLKLREGGDYYGYSIALGSPEVSLLELANAYRTLANGGRFSEAKPLARTAKAAKDATKSATPSTPAIDPRAAFIVGDILADGNARARTFGTDSVLATRFWTAVKTGTSKDMRDNWAVGWSQRYTVGVWVGNASGAPMHDVSGTSGAAPVWAAVMAHLHQREPSRAPTPPPGLVKQAVRFGNQLEAPREEWFLPGTQQAEFALAPAAATPAAAHIRAPANGTIIALDPDIPPQRQRVRFEAAGANIRWRIDGKDIPGGPTTSTTMDWLPWPGRHEVQLLGARGEVLDAIRIEVRGAGVKPSKAAALPLSKIPPPPKNLQSGPAAAR